MFEELKSITLSGKDYPIKCDLLVLEKIQDSYGDIQTFEDALIPWETVTDEDGNPEKDETGKIKTRGRFPDVKAVSDALIWMVQEGEEIQAEKENREAKKYSRETLVREADLSLSALAIKLHDEFFRCFVSKNGKTTTQKKSRKNQDPSS